ncbi:hypothetical protein M758_2G078500 [Ceratodon purpureus]|nr:hypothetical protein M758_2G078500 [Ceratodon purpureus]
MAVFWYSLCACDVDEQLDDDDEDEFKPLFDYSDTVPRSPELLSSDDSDEDTVIIKSALPKRKFEISPPKEPLTPTLQRDETQKTILDDDEDDDSWLMTSPSKLPKLPSSAYFAENPILQQIRLQRQELMMLQQKASPEAIRRVEELARMQAQQRPEPVTPLVVKAPTRMNAHEESLGSESPAAEEKEKILLKVQNSTQSTQSIRIFTTDKFEKLFRVYADLTKLPLESMAFRFDGDQISPNSSPKELDMEEGDIIEVYIRS